MRFCRRMAALAAGAAVATGVLLSEAVNAQRERGRFADMVRDVADSHDAAGCLTVTGPVSGLEVRIDGRRVGSTPLKRRRLAPAQYRLEVDRLHGAPLAASVAIRSGEEHVVTLPPPFDGKAVLVRYLSGAGGQLHPSVGYGKFRVRHDLILFRSKEYAVVWTMEAQAVESRQDGTDGPFRLVALMQKGTYSAEGPVLVFDKEDRHTAGSKGHLVRWGDRQYLLRCRKRFEETVWQDFCNAVNEGTEPRRTATGGFHYLRSGDWRKPVRGLPAIPESCQKYLLREPLAGVVGGLSLYRVPELERVGRPKAVRHYRGRLPGELELVATIALPNARGLVAGMYFYHVSNPVRLRVTRVKDRAAEAVVSGTEWRGGISIEVGDEVITRIEEKR